MPAPLGSVVPISLSEDSIRLLGACSRKLGELEGNPIVDVAFVAERLGIARTTANNLVKDFVKSGILVQREKERQRYRAFLYEDYLDILRQGSDPL